MESILQWRAVYARSHRGTFWTFLLPLANAASVDDNIVIVRDAVNSNGSKGEVLEVHGDLCVDCTEQL
jgi:hypothetical protein